MMFYWWLRTRETHRNSTDATTLPPLLQELLNAWEVAHLASMETDLHFLHASSFSPFTFFGMANRRQRIDIGDYGSAKRAKVEEGVNPWTGRPYSQRYLSILSTRTKLPVYQFKDELINKVLENQCVVVEGETGSGKTTQIGQ